MVAETTAGAATIAAIVSIVFEDISAGFVLCFGIGKKRQKQKQKREISGLASYQYCVSCRVQWTKTVIINGET